MCLGENDRHVRSRFLIFLIFLFFLFAGGCGPGGEPAEEEESREQVEEQITDMERKEKQTAERAEAERREDEDEEAEEKPEEKELAFTFDRWENPQNLTSLMEVFASLEFDVVITDNPGRIEYAYEGREEVDGVDVCRVAVSVISERDGFTLTFFFDDEGEVVQVKDEGVILPPERGRRLVEPVFALLFMPFNAIEDILAVYEPGEVMAGKHPQVEVQSVKTGYGTFGSLSGKLYEALIDVAYEGESQKARWQVGDLGSIQMMTAYEMIDVPNEDYLQYSLDSVELRP